MERKIIYLINPISGTGKKDSLEKLIHKKTTEQNILYQVLYTNAEGLSLKDSEEVIHVNNLSPINTEEKENLITFNKYPTLQFAGF